ncbi:hypothetical protein Bp8pS_231 [Bacillus phage vB_BpuM-BpSp]|nr:hypothetical protein Bp8pS_231 [Bacillus phage vB_BpuM-BpSp]
MTINFNVRKIKEFNHEKIVGGSLLFNEEHSIYYLVNIMGSEPNIVYRIINLRDYNFFELDKKDLKEDNYKDFKILLPDEFTLETTLKY